MGIIDSLDTIHIHALHDDGKGHTRSHTGDDSGVIMKKSTKDLAGKAAIFGALLLLILVASCFMLGYRGHGHGNNQTTTTIPWTTTSIPFGDTPCSELCGMDGWDGGWGPVDETSDCYEQSSDSSAVIFGSETPEGPKICCCWDEWDYDSSTSTTIYVPPTTTTSIPIAWVCCMGETTFFCAENICPAGTQYLWMVPNEDYCRQNCGG